MSNYNSNHTGQEVDAGIDKIINQGVSTASSSTVLANNYIIVGDSNGSKCVKSSNMSIDALNNIITTAGTRLYKHTFTGVVSTSSGPVLSFIVNSNPSPYDFSVTTAPISAIGSSALIFYAGGVVAIGLQQTDNKMGCLYYVLGGSIGQGYLDFTNATDNVTAY